jgi:hypothetical protein
MIPIEFITNAADNDYNTAAGKLHEALTLRPVIIRGESCEYQILSYYYDREALCMVLDIEEKK